MKFSKLSQLFLVSTIGLLVATLLSACQIVTIDYLFIAGSSSNSGGTGQIDTYAVDSESGAVRTVGASISTGGNSPSALAVSSDYANLYVANQSNNTVVHFSIASTGILTQKDTVTVAGAPVAMAVNTANTYLYVLYGTTSATIGVYPLSSGAIGAAASTVPLVVPGFTGDLLIPTAITVLPNNNAVFATLYDQSAYNPGGTTSSNANPGWVFGYAVGTNGALTASAGSPYQAGVRPTGIAPDPVNRFVYVTDYASNQLIGYGIQSGSTLAFLINGPFRTGSEPSAVVVDPRGKFIYVANSLDSTVSAFAIDLGTGTPTAAVNTTGVTTNATDTQPNAILVDPALGRFVYTANHLGNSMSGFFLNPTSGSLSPTQSTPYPSLAAPTALVCVPHGNHSLQSVTP